MFVGEISPNQAVLDAKGIIGLRGILDVKGSDKQLALQIT